MERSTRSVLSRVCSWLGLLVALIYARCYYDIHDCEWCPLIFLIWTAVMILAELLALRRVPLVTAPVQL